LKLDTPENRLDFLARANELLGAQLDHDHTVASVVRLAVPALATYGVLELARPNGEVFAAAIRHENAAMEDPIRDQRQRAGESAGGYLALVNEVMKSGRSRILPNVPDEALQAMFPHGAPPHADAARSCSAMIVPLVASHRPLGVLTLVSTDPRRRYDPSDLVLAEDLAYRAAMALENAELYARARDASRHDEQTLALLYTLFDTAPIGLGFLNLERRFVRGNGWLNAAAGTPGMDVAGRTVAEVLPELADELDPLVRRAMEQGEPTVNHELNRRDAATGGSRDWLASVYPVIAAGDEQLGAGLILVDVSERRRAVEQIRTMQEGLEETVKDRTSDLESAVQELEAFSYSISHDLRAPLRSIRSFSDLLASEHSARLPAEGRRQLDFVREGAERMSRLIDDLLQFSRYGRRTIEKQPVDPGTIAREALTELALDTGDGDPEISIGSLPTVSADPALFRQVLVNLISNAVKYSRSRKPARIEIGSLAGRHGETVFYVRDNGVGFDMHYADRLFGVFQRLHPAQEYEGTGVGLAIVQRIVRRHGGQVWAESAPDRGATFYFTIG